MEGLHVFYAQCRQMAVVNATPAAWHVLTLRATAFVAPDAPTAPSDWWGQLVGLPPEIVISRPKLGQHQQDGSFEGRKLTLQIQPERIDWTFMPADVQSPEELEEGLPSAGSLSDALGPFHKLVLAWLPLAPPVTRLAFGAILFQPAENRRAGYAQIAGYIPSVKLDPDGSSDFLYQINRPRDSVSGIGGLRINRLTKWSVMLFERVRVEFKRPGVVAAGSLAMRSACRLELDINTSPEFSGPLPHERLQSLFEELLTLGQEIAAKGDVP